MVLLFRIPKTIKNYPTNITVIKIRSEIQRIRKVIHIEKKNLDLFKLLSHLMDKRTGR